MNNILTNNNLNIFKKGFINFLYKFDKSKLSKYSRDYKIEIFINKKQIYSFTKNDLFILDKSNNTFNLNQSIIDNINKLLINGINEIYIIFKYTKNYNDLFNINFINTNFCVNFYTNNKIQKLFKTNIKYIPYYINYNDFTFDIINFNQIIQLLFIMINN